MKNGNKNGSDRSKKIYHYTVFLEPLPEGGYNVVVPAIPEVCTFGSTLKEAKEMAADAISCFIESALEDGERIPQNIPFRKNPVKATIEVACSR